LKNQRKMDPIVWKMDPIVWKMELAVRNRKIVLEEQRGLVEMKNPMTQKEMKKFWKLISSMNRGRKLPLCTRVGDKEVVHQCRKKARNA
jgi:hypothetical protein